jgi:hypothetical protein
MNENNERVNAINNELYKGYQEVNKIKDDIISLKNMNDLWEKPEIVLPTIKNSENTNNVRRGRGRPKGSKNKINVKINAERDSENDNIQEENTKQKKRNTVIN